MDPVPVHRFLTVGNRVFIREIFPQNLQSLVVRSVFHVFPGLSLQSLFLRRAAFLFQKPVDTPDLSVVAQLSSSRLIRRRSVPAPWGNSPPPMSFRSRIRRRRTVLRSAAPSFPSALSVTFSSCSRFCGPELPAAASFSSLPLFCCPCSFRQACSNRLPPMF